MAVSSKVFKSRRKHASVLTIRFPAANPNNCTNCGEESALTTFAPPAATTRLASDHADAVRNRRRRA